MEGYRRCRWRLLPALLVLFLAACAASQPSDPARLGGEGGVYKLGRPYRVGGRWYVPRFDPHYEEVGLASWYGREFQGRRTANGEIFDPRRLTAAHPTLPLPSLVEVTNLENGRRIRVRVNDRGPFVPGRVIDLSEAAAVALGFRERGLARVRVRFLALAEAAGTPPRPETVAAAESGICPTAFGYVVQAGAFRDAARAGRKRERLAGLAPARIVPASVNPTSPLYRVQLGPFATRAQAEAVRARLAKLGVEDAFVYLARGETGETGSCPNQRTVAERERE